MAPSVLITGVSGTGKTTVVSELDNRGHRAYDLEGMAEYFTHINPETGEVYEEFDQNDLEMLRKGEYVCDTAKLKNLVQDNAEPLTFFGFAASNLEELFPLFDEIVLLTASKESIRERLSKRPVWDFGGPPEVQEWVLGWRDEWEDTIRDEGAITISTDQNIEETVTAILNAVRN